MDAEGVGEGGEGRSSEALGHAIAPVKVSRNVGDLQSAVASLLTQVVGADVKVLGRELVGSSNFWTKQQQVSNMLRT